MVKMDYGVICWVIVHYHVGTLNNNNNKIGFILKPRHALHFSRFLL